MKKLILFGSGGHAKVVASIAEEYKDIKLEYVVSKEIKLFSNKKLKIISDDNYIFKNYEKFKEYFFFVGIGDNKIRKRIQELLILNKFKILTIISKKAHIHKSVKIGVGSVIMPGVVIEPDARIGDGVIINTGATLDHDCVIDNFVHIAPGCNLAGNVIIKKGVFLGVGTKVIPKIIIGKWVVAGAGSVIVDDINDFSFGYGVPYKVKSYLTFND